MKTVDRLRNLLHRMETDPYFSALADVGFEEFWDRFSEDEVAKILEYISFICPPPEKTDNGDGTFTYVFRQPTIEEILSNMETDEKGRE